MKFRSLGPAYLPAHSSMSLVCPWSRYQVEILYGMERSTLAQKLPGCRRIGGGGEEPPIPTHKSAGGLRESFLEGGRTGEGPALVENAE